MTQRGPARDAKSLAKSARGRSWCLQMPDGVRHGALGALSTQWQPCLWCVCHAHTITRQALAYHLSGNEGVWFATQTRAAYDTAAVAQRRSAAPAPQGAGAAGSARFSAPDVSARAGLGTVTSRTAHAFLDFLLAPCSPCPDATPFPPPVPLRFLRAPAM